LEDAVAQRIVLVESDLVTGGHASVTSGLACYLKSRGREVTVLCTGGSGADQLQRRGIPTLVYSPANRPWMFWTRQSVEAELLDLKPDLLHAQTHSLARYVKNLATFLNCPYLVTVSEHLDRPRDLPYNKALLKRVIAASDPLREALVNAAKVPKDLVRLIPNGVNLADYRPFQREPEEEGNGIGREPKESKGNGNGSGNGKMHVIGMIAPMEKEKGQEFFLRAAKAVLDERDDVQFLVAGRGPETDRFRKLSAKLGLTPSLTFVDYVDDHGLLLSAMDVFVLPTVEEGHGVTLLEAMACGRPVVASGVGGLYSIVRDRETGLIVPRQDANALAQAMLELVNEPALADDLAQQALEMVESEFDQDSLFGRLLGVYDEAVAVPANGNAGQA